LPLSRFKFGFGAVHAVQRLRVFAYFHHVHLLSSNI
jgi:hypothetical protein